MPTHVEPGRTASPIGLAPTRRARHSRALPHGQQRQFFCAAAGGSSNACVCHPRPAAAIRRSRSNRVPHPCAGSVASWQTNVEEVCSPSVAAFRQLGDERCGSRADHLERSAGLHFDPQRARSDAMCPKYQRSYHDARFRSQSTAAKELRRARHLHRLGDNRRNEPAPGACRTPRAVLHRLEVRPLRSSGRRTDPSLMMWEPPIVMAAHPHSTQTPGFILVRERPLHQLATPPL